MNNGTSERTLPLVLVVDDDFSMRLLMRETLEQNGFRVEEAEDGVPALEMFKSKQPDILLLDVMMPEMDGFTVCTELRKTPAGRHIPILLVTGLDDVESINRAYEAGATDFITKPITWPLLSYRVRYVLRASQAIERVGKSEARLAHAQAIARLGNWEWDVPRNKLHCSEEVRRIIGHDCSGFEGTFNSFLKSVHPDDRAALKQAVEEARQTGKSYNLDHRIILPDGSIRIVHQHGESILNEARQTVVMNGTIQDITERKRVENELKQYRNHLEELVEKRTAELTVANVKLKEAKNQAEQASELKDKFISLVAHDLRSPLAGILTALDYMYTDTEAPLNEDHQDIVGRLLKIGKSLVQMIEDVLNVGRLKTGKVKVKRVNMDGHEAVAAAIDSLSYLAKQKGVTLINEVPPGTRIYADPALYGEVIQNLTSNGIKFCNKGERVRFFMLPEEAASLAVEDNGVGVNPKVLPNLFRIEEKTSTPGTAGEQGTGFGLPFSHDIMTAHGGSLSVESELGKGTTFFVKLPENKSA
ncbi:MAG: response regulator [Gammaproteobacteria bacterium]|nr:response regulator [Gammaproteobacteria bacterium]